MSNMTITPTNVVETVTKLVKVLGANIESQVFYSETGAVVLTDKATYEVYTYGDECIVQMLIATSDGWHDMSHIPL